MADGARQDVLGQKASAGRRAFEARGMSPSKALRRALSRTADVLWDLALVTRDPVSEELDQDGVVARLPPEALLLLLDGPDGALGIVAVDREVMTGVTEVQTILQVTQMPVEKRPLTQTDAAMMAPLIDGTMERMVRYLDGHPLLPQVEGFRFGAMVEDARTAALLLDATGYRGFTVPLDLALGRRKGELRLFFPDRPAAGAEVGSGRAEDGAAGPHEQKMKLLPAQMEAVLGRVTLTLRQAQALRAGDLLPLSPAVLDRVEFYAGPGRAVAGGRLGQMNGMRAVRLSWPAGAPQEMPEAPEGDDVFDMPLASQPAPPTTTPAPVMDPLPEPETAELSRDEVLGDLPALDFDIGTFDEGGGEAQQVDLGDFDFAAAPLDLDES